MRWTLLFAGACLGVAAIGHLIVVRAGGVSLPAVWPLSGVLIGTLLLADRRAWTMLVAIACGAMLVAEVLLGRALLQSAALSAVLAIEGVTAAWLLRRLFHKFSLAHLPHIWGLLGVGTLAPMAGGLIAAGVLSLDGAAWAIAWRAWWLSDALGIVLVTPLVVGAATEWTSVVRARRASRTIEIAAVLAVGAAVSTSIFGGLVDPLVRVPAFLLPFFLWSVFRWGVGGTAATVLLLSAIGLWNTAQGRGPFALPDATIAEWLLRAQGTGGIAAASLLLMAGVVAERRRIAGENELLVADLQKALTEIKTLRGFIPICAWCHKVRDDAGFWQQIETYLDARTDATFSHSICPTCTEQAHLELIDRDDSVPSVTRRQ